MIFYNLKYIFLKNEEFITTKKTKLFNESKITNPNLTPKFINDKKNFSPLLNSREKLYKIILLKSIVLKTNFFNEDKNILKSSEIEENKLRSYKTPLIWTKKPLIKNKKDFQRDYFIIKREKSVRVKSSCSPKLFKDFSTKKKIIMY